MNIWDFNFWRWLRQSFIDLWKLWIIIESSTSNLKWIKGFWKFGEIHKLRLSWISRIKNTFLNCKFYRQFWLGAFHGIRKRNLFICWFFVFFFDEPYRIFWMTKYSTSIDKYESYDLWIMNLWLTGSFSTSHCSLGKYLSTSAKWNLIGISIEYLLFDWPRDETNVNK